MTRSAMANPAADSAIRRAVPAHAIARWMLSGLLPGFLVQAYAYGPGYAWQCMASLTACFALDVILRMQAGADAPDPQPLSLAAVALCWLPAALPWWSVLTTALLTWSIARAFAHRRGGSPLHPAMIGVSVGLLTTADMSRFAIDPALVLATGTAFTLAGIGLAIGRCIRWPVALAAATGAAATVSTWVLLHVPLPDREQLLGIVPAASVLIFFVATDPSSGCRWPRARITFGMGAGILAAIAVLALHDVRRAYAGMAGAVLLMNALAPTLDRLLPLHPPRKAPHP